MSPASSRVEKQISSLEVCIAYSLPISAKNIMTVPKPPHMSIVILTLIPVIALAWSSFTAPCIEIGFFWASVVTALSASLYAWCNSNRMGQGGMLKKALEVLEKDAFKR